MDNAELWSRYAERTKEATTTFRTLGFAAGAACWVLGNEQAALPALLAISLMFVVTGFVFDVAQLAWQASYLKRFAEREEGERWRKHKDLDGEPYLLPKGWDNWPARFWVAKLACLGLSWVLIVVHVGLSVFGVIGEIDAVATSSHPTLSIASTAFSSDASAYTAITAEPID